MQQRLDKPFYDLRAGLVTEAGPLSTPDGATVDEQNFHLLIDGSRRRRRGVTMEYEGVPITLPEYDGVRASRVGKWANAGSVPENDFVVIQVGLRLYFLKDSGTSVSKNLYPVSLDLLPYITGSEITRAEAEPVSITSGNGVLVVVARYLNPISVEWDTDLDAPVASKIKVAMRDFRGVGGKELDYRLKPKTLTPEHKYNLINRGWKQTDIDSYFTAESEYPSLNMLWHKGYAREVDGTAFINEDGVRTWNTAKIVAEPFPNQSAPQGALLLDPFDTTIGFGDFTEALTVESWEITETTTSKYTISITTSAPHGLSPLDSFFISGQSSVYLWREPEAELNDITLNMDWSFDGEQRAWVGTTGSTLTFRIDKPTNFDSWVDQFKTLGYVSAGDTLENPDGYVTDERYTACAWYAGRVWMAGAAHPRLSDKIFFSQLVTRNGEYGSFFQRNDPTNEALNALIATDGGVIQLSDIGSVMGIMPYQNVLLLFCDNGVWEISGSRGVFTPDNFSIRKITDSECSSPWGFVEAEGRVLFLGVTGVFMIQPDERTGVLFARSITEAKIQQEWAKIPASRYRVAKMAYDRVNKQAWILYDYESGVADSPTGEPTRRFYHESTFSHASSVDLERSVSYGNPVDPRKIEFRDGEEGEPWVKIEYDTWSDTAISVTPPPRVGTGARYWRVTSAAGVVSNFVQNTVTSPFVPFSDTVQIGFGDPLTQATTKFAYRDALNYDMRLDAWTKFKFPEDRSNGKITGIFQTRDSTGCGVYANLKFLVLGNNTLRLMDMCRGKTESDLFLDWTGTEESAYLLMGPDSLENWQNRRHAPIVHVFSRATEIGRGVNPSSIIMRSQWDWTDDVDTGKWGTEQETHRRVRPFIPVSDEDYKDGYPIVVTRNKVRGRGRALQLMFQSKPEHDAHLHGYAVRYHVSGRV